MTKLRAGQVAAPRRSHSPRSPRSTSPGSRRCVAAGTSSADARALQAAPRHSHPARARPHPGAEADSRCSRCFLRDRQSTGLSSWTRKGMLTPIGRVFSLAVRRGYLSENPLLRLESEELPKGKSQGRASRPRSRRDRSAACSRSRAVHGCFGDRVFSGLRAMELLGLCWSCIDFEQGIISVRHQLTRGSKENPRSSSS